MAEGFFSRWSRRKAGLEKEATLSEEQVIQTPPPATSDGVLVEQADEGKQTPPSPTLADVEKIDRFAPDFSAFMQPGVDPIVQQAALKKMFTDPHFNVMDGLDIYIDDYSKPDPLTPGMLERMAQSDMLNLFRANSEVYANEGQHISPSSSQDNPEGQSLVRESKTDLTSSVIEESNEPSNLSNPSSELEQKKT